MRGLATFGDMLAEAARLRPNSVGAADLERDMTNALWFQRSCRLGNALIGLGLVPGDRFCILAHNRLEWLEIYAAASLTGLVAVPINFRLSANEVAYIIQDCDARAIITEAGLCAAVDDVRHALPVPMDRFVVIGAEGLSGWHGYEALIGSAAGSSPSTGVSASDAHALLYTSGTTGHPKGAIRSNVATTMLSLTTALEMNISARDRAMLIMPMCHANSYFFMGAFAFVGAPICVYSRPSFDPGEALASLARTGSTFTSLVPTHYAMLLDLPGTARPKSLPLNKLMISSAPARMETKQAIMELFSSAGLYELYGSTETGYVTMLHPDEQFAKLGSVGRECIGTGRIRLLDEAGNEVADGESGELYSCNSYTFDGYWGLPGKTAEAFRGDYCSVGDIARRDADGYLHLIGRRSNMIISGGENIYPSEVEAVLAMHPGVRDVAVIGLPDPLWGERVHAVIVPRETGLASGDLLDWCGTRIAGFKRPRSISLIAAEEMPKTVTGKIQHAKLKQRLAADLSAPEF
ncbi:acyl--CoA ligase [Defluviimonas sp. WL0002]|uniref:Acyl--CoA ligase n=1 Tax=Albidovulum marisflavi TaxID=2984159 RepID=A0ABT2ZGU6_9RHOB|nr:class I adenylate-forming enzyme family protein [Defluviimonas sp. WL0002]MCV2870326.1 acyl--CoA ligase [Defluviimonas sp. WL0002]